MPDAGKLYARLADLDGLRTHILPLPLLLADSTGSSRQTEKAQQGISDRAALTALWSGTGQPGSIALSQLGSKP